MATRRAFGIAPDPTPGGTNFDTLTDELAGVIPAPTEYVPTTGGSADKGLDRLERDNEVIPQRGRRAPYAFKSMPVISLPLNAYPHYVEKLVHMALGSDDTVTPGASGGPSSHGPFKPLPYGADALPAACVYMVRDNFAERFTGCVVDTLTFAAPIDGWATLEASLRALYRTPATPLGGVPTIAANLGRPLVLRDAKLYGGPNGTVRKLDVQSFNFTINNNVRTKEYAGSCIDPATGLWFGTEHRLSADHEITYEVGLGNTDPDEELLMDLAASQKLVFELAGETLPGVTPAAKYMMRVTINRAVHTGGGAEALTKSDDITSRFEGGAFIDETTGDDFQVEFINGSTDPITV